MDIINQYFEEINDKYNKVISDYQKDFNLLRTESTVNQLPNDIKNELISLVKTIPSQLPNRIEDIYKIYVVCKYFSI